jgi:hypothetical protein
LDPRFDKSYGRLIHSACKTDNLPLAETYANQLKMLFDEKTVEKYQEYFKILESKKAEEDERLKELIKKNKIVRIFN